MNVDHTARFQLKINSSEMSYLIHGKVCFCFSATKGPFWRWMVLKSWWNSEQSECLAFCAVNVFIQPAQKKEQKYFLFNIESGDTNIGEWKTMLHKTDKQMQNAKNGIWCACAPHPPLPAQPHSSTFLLSYSHRNCVRRIRIALEFAYRRHSVQQRRFNRTVLRRLSCEIGFCVFDVANSSFHILFLCCYFMCEKRINC